MKLPACAPVIVAATPLDDSARLDEVGVVDGDVLHLTNKGPQVDG